MNAIIHTGCRICKSTTQITVPMDGYIAWINGELIQKALPDLSLDDRELLISHTCGECWEAMFPPEEVEQIEA